MWKTHGKRGKSFGLPALSFLLALLLFAPDLLADNYSYTDIHPPGWIASRAVRLNSRGEAVGFGVTVSGERGFLWSSGRITVILPPGADEARALWINDRGEIAGTAVTGGIRRAFLLQGGKYVDPTPGWAFSGAAYVGEDGSVAGNGEFGAYLSRGGVTEILPGLSSVVAGNSTGELLGVGSGTARLYLPGRGYLDLTPPGTTSASPRGINESGRIAVTSHESGIERGFIFSAPFFIAMTPPGWHSSHASAINDLEVVAGFGDSPEGRRSFLRIGAEYTVLSFPGWTATEALAINDPGQVAGSGTTASGETRAFVASPALAAAASSKAAIASGGCSMALRGEPGLTGAGPLLPAFSLLLLLTRRKGPFRRQPRTDGIPGPGAGEKGRDP